MALCRVLLVMSQLLFDATSPSFTNHSQLSPVVAWCGDEGTALL